MISEFFSVDRQRIGFESGLTYKGALAPSPNAKRRPKMERRFLKIESSA